MKKQNDSEFGDNYSQRQMIALARLQKIQAEGKWLWIFKRGAAWLTSVLFLYGLGILLFPTFLQFNPIQCYVLAGMFAGFIFSSLIEWSKMEAQFPEQEELN